MFGKKLVLALFAVAAVSTAQAQEIVTIKLARSNAAEDNLWMMLAKPSLAPNLGKAYKLEWSQFRSSDQTFKAFEAGQLDIATASANAVIVAASKGLGFKAVASLSLESVRGTHTPFLVREDGPKTIAELKGKTVGISGYRTSTDLWARAALRTANLNPDRDVNWAVVPFPAMGEALRAGKVDVAGLPAVFADGEVKKGGLRQLFTSKTGVPFDEELILLVADPAFLKKHPAAVKAS
jgi:ABC-type nitrate/sulfonate/bicarbonate transport system substrate-binding protein